MSSSLPIRQRKLSNGTEVRVFKTWTEVVLPSGVLVSGVPEGNDRQDETAENLGYDNALQMVLDHDPLHALLCDWLGLSTSFALENPDSEIAWLEEKAVLAVQEFMRKAKGRLPL